MKYLFFDIECSDGYHICSFGYTLTNEKLQVLKKEDIVINPESRFILAAKGKRPKIELAYSEDFFKKQKTFDKYYEKIKKLLLEENVLIFGHSITSDFHFLDYACDRYHLPKFTLRGYDTQKISQKYFKSQHVESLEKIVSELEINPKHIRFHKSSDDAHASMLVVKAICEREKIDVLTLVKNYNDCIVDLSKQKSKQDLLKEKLKSKNSENVTKEIKIEKNS